jgi:hypothetical protein
LWASTRNVLDARTRIVSTREPVPARGPIFALDRGTERVAWAAHRDTPELPAESLARLAREERPSGDFASEPVHAARYVALIRAALAPREVVVFHGPGFTFPLVLPEPSGAVQIADEMLLARHFRGWLPGEIAAGRAPAFAVLGDDGAAVSVCCCARRSDVAAEAGVETSAIHRGQGLAPRTVAAWARALRDGGRTPLYSTAWSNTASLAVARKLALTPYASHWHVSAA